MRIIGRFVGLIIPAQSGWTLVRAYRAKTSDGFILLAFIFFLTALGLLLLIGSGVSLLRALRSQRRLQHY